MLEKVDQIDFNELYVLLLDASRKAFRDAQAAHPDETFYVFALHYDVLEYVLVSCNSEEAHMHLHNLTEFERDNQTLKWFYDRWGFFSWKYHLWGKKYFPSVSEWIEHNLYQPISNARGDEVIPTWVTVNDGFATVCLNVLKTLDQEKIFGQGKAREKVVLNVVSNNRHEKPAIDHVYLLNPASTYARWCVEMELYNRARAFLIL